MGLDFATTLPYPSTYFTLPDDYINYLLYEEMFLVKVMSYSKSEVDTMPKWRRQRILQLYKEMKDKQENPSS